MDLFAFDQVTDASEQARAHKILLYCSQVKVNSSFLTHHAFVRVCVQHLSPSFVFLRPLFPCGSSFITIQTLMSYGKLSEHYCRGRRSRAGSTICPPTQRATLCGGTQLLAFRVEGHLHCVRKAKLPRIVPHASLTTLPSPTSPSLQSCGKTGCSGKLYACKGCGKKFCAQSKGCGFSKYGGNACRPGCGASKVAPV